VIWPYCPRPVTSPGERSVGVSDRRKQQEVTAWKGQYADLYGATMIMLLLAEHENVLFPEAIMTVAILVDALAAMNREI
jgi:hypothetical protein